MKQFTGRLFAGRLFAGRLFRTPVHDAAPAGSMLGGGHRAYATRKENGNEARISRQNELILALVMAAVTKELI